MSLFMRFVLIALLVALVPACDGSDPTAASSTAASSTAAGATATNAATPAADGATATQAQSEATVRIGDLTIRANALQTSMLAPTVAQQYGIARDARSVLLMVTIRQGAGSDAFTLPAVVTASVTDLRGTRHDLSMRELHSAGPEAGSDLVDYIGTVETSLPDTLRFDIRVQPEGSGTATLQLSRDFYPQ